MAEQTNKFSTGSAVSSTVTSSVLPGTVNLIGPDGKVIQNAEVNTLTNQVKFKRVIDCCDAGQVPLTIKFTGDAVNAGGGIASANLSVANSHGSTTQNNAGTVNKIVPGPGIYLTNNGEGTVTISLEPIRTTIQPTESFGRVVWTQSDAAHPNISDQSCFIAFGNSSSAKSFPAGLGGVIGSGQFAVRSRDGENWVELNNHKSGFGNTFGVAIQSHLLPGSGLAYFGSCNVVDTSNHYLLVNQSVAFGIEGRTDNVECGWCSDAFDQGGPFSGRSAAASGHTHCFYAGTGSILTDALYLDFGIDNTPVNGQPTNNSASCDIFRYNQSPATFLTTDTTVTLDVTVETSLCSGTYLAKAASDIDPTNLTNYNICVAGLEGTKGYIYKSVRNANNLSTWTAVVSTSSRIRGIAYGNGIWMAVGDADNLYLSTDTINWQNKTTGWPGSNWRDIEYGNGYFMAVGDFGYITYTDDYGRTWQRAQSGTTSTLRSVAFSPKLCSFAAVGDHRAITTLQLCNPPATASLPTITPNVGLSDGPGCILSWYGGSGGGGGGGGSNTWQLSLKYGATISNGGNVIYYNTATTNTTEPELRIQSPWSVLDTTYDPVSHPNGQTSGANFAIQVSTVSGGNFTDTMGYFTIPQYSSQGLQWELILPNGSHHYSDFYSGHDSSPTDVITCGHPGDRTDASPLPPGSNEWLNTAMVNTGPGGSPIEFTFSQGAPYVVTLKLNQVTDTGTKSAGNIIKTWETHSFQVTWI
jgi:hypothetical protein